MKTPKIFASLLSLALVAGFTVSSSATKAEALDPSAPCYSYFYQYPVTPAIVNNTVTCLTVTNASFYSQNLFTVTTWNYFQDQLDMVPLYLSIGMQEEALTGLNFGVDALAYRGNTTSLQATVNSLPGYGDSALYTTATWDDYWDANQDAEDAIFDNSDLNQTQVDLLELALVKAYINLVEVNPQPTALDALIDVLQDLIDEVQALDPTDYTGTSWNTLQNGAYSNALDVVSFATNAIATDDPTISDVQTAITDLAAGIAALVVDPPDAPGNPEVDALTDALQQLVNNASTVQASDYEANSYADLQDAIDEANDLIADPTRTAALLQFAIDNVGYTLGALVPAALPSDTLDALLDVLQDLIDQINGLDPDDFTSDSWDAFEANALDPAQQVLDDANDGNSANDPTVADVQAALGDLSAGLSALEPVLPDAPGNPVVDSLSGVLEDLKDVATSLTSTNYTSATWADLQTAVAGATTVLANTARTTGDIQGAIDDLNDAIANLAPALADTTTPVINALKTSLQNLVSSTSGLTSSDYTPTSWTALSGALTAASTQLSAASPTIADLQTAISNLSNAISGLDPAPADTTTPVVNALKTSLQNLVNSTNSLTAADYTTASWTALTTAKTNANTVLGAASPTVTDLQTAISNLSTAISGLDEPAADTVTPVITALRTTLTNLVNSTNSLTAADYTSATWNALTTAKNAANTVLGGSPTVTDLQTAATNLANALSGLEEVPPTVDTTTPVVTALKQTLQNQIAAANSLNSADYTAASWAPVAAAITAATTEAGSVGATIASLQSAASTLANAIGALVVNPPATPVDGSIDNLTTALNSLVTQASGLTEANYTAETWTALQTALTAAKTEAANASRTAASLQAANTALGKAITALTPKPTGTVTTTDDNPQGTNTTTTAKAVKVKNSQNTVTLLKGKSMGIFTLAYTSTGAKVAVTYKSSNTKVATVSAKGTIKAIKKGTATITMTSGTKKATLKVTVVSKKPSKSKVTKVSATGVPKTMKVKAVKYITGKYSPSTALSAKVSFKSSKPTVVTVDKAGRLTAKAKGKAVITVKAGSKTKKYTITVK